MKKSPSPFDELINKMKSMFAERKWIPYHTPKNLAMKLSVEVGELTEHFCWLTEHESFVKDPKHLSEIRDEIGDVFILLTHLSEQLGIDPLQAALDKLDKVAVKYPVEKCQKEPLTRKWRQE